MPIIMFVYPKGLVKGFLISGFQKKCLALPNYFKFLITWFCYYTWLASHVLYLPSPLNFMILATMQTFHVNVTTCDERSAGTDANVYITLYGENGDTGKHFLKSSKTHRDKFWAWKYGRVCHRSYWYWRATKNKVREKISRSIYFPPSSIFFKATR